MTAALSGSEAKLINPWRGGLAAPFDTNLRGLMPMNETKWMLQESDSLLPERQWCISRDFLVASWLVI